MPKDLWSVSWRRSKGGSRLLPPETERVWNCLKQQPALAGFVLVGGSALALRIRHRRSDDLDIAYPAHQLPRARLELAWYSRGSGKGARLPGWREPPAQLRRRQEFSGGWAIGLQGCSDDAQSAVRQALAKVSPLLRDSLVRRI